MPSCGAVTLTELLEEIRNLYVTELSRVALAAAGKRSKNGKAASPLVHVEPLLRDKGGAALREGALRSAVRLDLVKGAVGAYEDVRVDSNSRLEFEPVTVPWSDRLTVTIEPFVWDAVVVETDVPVKTSVAVARPWLDEWMDTKEARSPGHDGLARVVHFAADPTPRSGGGSTLAIDLGSGPPEALLALLDAFGERGAKKIRVSSEPASWDGEDEAKPAKARKAAKKTSARTAKPKRAASAPKAKKPAKKAAKKPAKKAAKPKAAKPAASRKKR